MNAGKSPLCRLASRGCSPYGTIGGYFSSREFHFFVRKKVT